MKPVRLHKGSYVLCKYRGDNGDMVAGVVESVRSNGDIICKSLFADTKHTKSVEVFNQRNILVRKRDAERVVEVYEKSLLNDPSARVARIVARKLAVEIASQYKKEAEKEQEQLPLSEENDDLVGELTKGYKLLSEDEKKQFIRETLLSDVLRVVG